MWARITLQTYLELNEQMYNPKQPPTHISQNVPISFTKTCLFNPVITLTF